MNRLASALVALAAFGTLGCPSAPPAPAPPASPAPAPAAGPSDPDRLELSLELPPGTARATAREEAVARAFEATLEEWSFAALKGQRRAAVIARAGNMLRGERVREDARGVHYAGWVSRDEVRNRILDALAVEETFGRDPFVLAPLGNEPWFEGEGLSFDQADALPRRVRAALGDALGRLRCRETSSDRDQIQRAALELGASPTSQALAAFADLFQAPLVVSFRGRIRFWPHPYGSAAGRSELGRLGCEGVEATLYDRASDTILARVSLESPPELRAPQGRLLPRLPVPREEPLAAACERYADRIGERLAAQLARRLFERFYAGDRRE